MRKNERLRQHRIQRNWRQQDLADQLQTSLVTVQRWERGTHQPRAYYRIKLCMLFDTSPEELGLLEENSAEGTLADSVQVLRTDASEEVALWTVPYARNLHFTGRDEMLDQLTQQLTPVVVDQPTSIRRVALTQSQIIKGLGGIGKTQLAVEYAYRAREQRRYTYILWIAAASEEAILSSFGALPALLPTFPLQGETDQQKLVAAIIRWLEQCEQPWLLIFDNADNLPLIQPYLPHWGNGSILLTTRASAVGSFTSSSIEVDTMGVLEGTQLLLRRAHRFANASDEKIDEANNLVVELGLFPLALDQAGAYIEETGCSVSDYLHFYQQHRHELLSRRGKQTTGYSESVATTWSLAFQHIKQVNPATAELLCLCALLSPDHIPEELLTQGAPHWPPALQQAVVDPFSFDQMLEALLAFSLVKRLSKDRLLSIHRLVQVVQMDSMTLEVQRQWAQRVVCAVNTIFPRDSTDAPDTWPMCQRYLEQAQACDPLIQQYQLLLPEAGDLLDHTATYLRERALYTLAEPLYQRALHIREQLFGPNHAYCAISLKGLANLYWLQGKYKETEPLYLRALRIREQQLGPEHSDTAETINDLAVLYYHQGKYEEAEPLYLRALRIREQQLGPEHFLMAGPLNNLALLYYQQSKSEEAEPLILRALRIWEQQLGSKHSLVATGLNNLAFFYYQQGKYEEAEPLYLRALHIWEQHLGPEHPEMSWPLYGLALLYSMLHKTEEAELFFQRALHIREQQSGPEPPETAAILHDFADFRQAHGKTSEAIQMYQRALTIREQVFGPDHFLTIDTSKRLHAVLATLGPI